MAKGLAVLLLLACLGASVSASESCSTDAFRVEKDGTAYLHINQTSTYGCGGQDICAKLSLAHAQQTLTTGGSSLGGYQIGISGGNTITLPQESQTLSLNGQELSLTNGGSVTLPSGGSTQSLTTEGSTLSGFKIGISGGNQVTLPNEAQTLSVNTGTRTISITGQAAQSLPAAQVLGVNSPYGTPTLTLTNGGGSAAFPIPKAMWILRHSSITGGLSLSHSYPASLGITYSGGWYTITTPDYSNSGEYLWCQVRSPSSTGTTVSTSYNGGYQVAARFSSSGDLITYPTTDPVIIQCMAYPTA